VPEQTPFDSITAQLDLDGRWEVLVARKGCGTAHVKGRPGQPYQEVVNIASAGLRVAGVMAA